MYLHAWSAPPGADLIGEGLDDLGCGRQTIPSLLVSIGAPKLQSLGIPVLRWSLPSLPEHALYVRLQVEDARTAHSRYNALVGRLVSLERALARERVTPA